MKRIFLTTAFLLLASTHAMADAVYEVNVSTAPLEGVTGYLAFDFLQGFPVENNTVTISAFTSNAILGTLTPSGDAFGTISPGPGTLDDINYFFNELLQQVTFGAAISFTLDLSTDGAATPDEFAFYLLDMNQFPIPTSDPSGADSLFAINVKGSGLTPDIYTSSDATATLTPTGVTTPEPGSFLLLGSPLLALIRRRAKFPILSAD